MQAVVSGQAAVGVTVSIIQLLGALASVKSSAAGAMVMEERGAETRSAFLFFTLSTIFYAFSAGAYALLMNTPEYRENKGHSWDTKDLHIDLSELYR